MRRGGFTLIELLVAMAVFAALGTMILTLLRGSLDLFSKGERKGEILGKAEVALDLMKSDLSNVWIGDPAGRGLKVRFLCDYARGATGAKPVPRGDPRGFRLRFVRTIPGGEMSDTTLRLAGTRPGCSRVFDGRFLTQDEARDLLPPGGLMEICYVIDKGPSDGPGQYTLFRAVRSPAGSAGSFFDAGTEQAMEAPDWARKFAEPVVPGVTFLAALFEGQETGTYDEDLALARRPGAGGTGEGFPDLWWDSTRGLYEEFSLNRAGSAAVPEDDVFPRRIRIVMTVIRDGEDRDGPRLDGAILYNARRLELTTTAPFAAGGVEETYAKIDDEWLKIVSKDRSGIVVDRAARQTAGASHAVGAPVLVGKTYRLVVSPPCHRDHWEAPK